MHADSVRIFFNLFLFVLMIEILLLMNAKRKAGLKAFLSLLEKLEVDK